MKRIIIFLFIVISGIALVSCSKPKKNKLVKETVQQKVVATIDTLDEKLLLLKAKAITRVEEAKRIWLNDSFPKKVTDAAYERYIELMNDMIARINKPEEVKAIWMDNRYPRKVANVAYDKYKKLIKKVTTP